ncbi:MAG TPA: hypothetical protein ACFYEF_07865 [Candidatus Wunengus sp. YC63]|uniref:hypothetical protein n=1 Tax=unclassified Candidatus Wunengus TaxID=3367695 RepID=UPI0027138425|nr:hypothetical protein [Candidatus Brocadiales bacterium]
MKKVIVGLLIAFIMLVSVPISNVFAGGWRDPSSLPEPLAYLLIAACGATLASVRYWMAKRRCKKDKKIPMTSKMNRTCAFKFLGIEDISRRSPCQ